MTHQGRFGQWPALLPSGLWSTRASRPGDGAAIDRVAWTMAVASRFVPGTACLTRALASQVLLAERGIQADLHVGVARDHHGFRAHA